MNVFSRKQRKKTSSDKQKIRTVALIIETSNEYARGLLRGVKTFIREQEPWSLFLSEHSREDHDLSWLRNWRGDGILARIENDAIARYIQETGLPAVDLSAARLLPSIPFVETNDESIARMAADHFIERGFKHFAYYGDSHFIWSQLREEHFIRYLNHAGYTCTMFDHHAGEHRKQLWNIEMNRLMDWLRSLPKPVGIMACFDIRGQQLLEACRLARIRVPDEVAVIGVDNDDLICALSDPPLSSIIPNTLKTGYHASSLLKRLMDGEPLINQSHLIEPLGISTRLSTDVLSIHDKHVSDAIRLIRNHASQNINVQDVLEHIPLSRRALESRFQKAVGRTPHEEIIFVKLKLVKQLLIETELPISLIAERAGFEHGEYMSVMFKKNTGLSPSLYRQQHGQIRG